MSIELLAAGRSEAKGLYLAEQRQAVQGMVMKAGWVRSALREVTMKIGSGATPLGGEEAYKPSGISLIRSLNVYDDGFRERKLARIDEQQAARLSNAVVEADDVLLNITGASVARCCVAPAEFLPARVNQHVAIIRPVKHVLDSNFLQYLLISKTYKDRLLHTGEEGGSTRQAITKSQLQDFSIEFPQSLAEQRRIVAILDKAFDGIAAVRANAEKNLQDARGLFESYLQNVFEVRTGQLSTVRLEELCQKKRVITYGVIKLGDPIKDGVPCLRTSNVRWLEIDTTGMKRIAPSLSADYGRTILRGGEVLVNVRGTLGGVAVVPSEMNGWNVSREVAVVPIDSDLLDPEFAAFWIGSHKSQEWLSGVKKGATYTGINIEDLRNLPVPLPELIAQRTIVEAVLAIREASQNMEEIYRRKLTALDELKKSLLHRAFNGDL